MLVLTDEQRRALKRPLGILIPDAQITPGRVRAEAGQDARIVTVGDATTARFAALGIGADIEIVDGMERRGKGSQIPKAEGAQISCRNRPGTISAGAEAAVRRAFELPAPVRIRVDGEEDLLVLTACDACPDGTSVAYGQPGEGMVVVRVGPAARDKARRIIGSMQHRDDETVAG